MSVLKKSNNLKLVTAAAIITALAGYIQVAAEVPTKSGVGAVQTQSYTTLASVPFETPLCYAYTDRQHDAVLNLHKEKSVQAKFVSNTKLSAYVISQFEGRRVKRSDRLELKGDTRKVWPVCYGFRKFQKSCK